MPKRPKRSQAVGAAGMLALTVGWFSWAAPVSASEFAASPPVFIVGGTEVSKGKYPFMASIQLKIKSEQSGNEPEYHHWCGGSLRDSVTVITAAHCVAGINDQTADAFSITVGQTVLADEIGVQRQSIRAVAISAAKGSDLAYITLSEPVTGVLPVKLPTLDSDALYSPGQLATVMGWGNTDPDLPYYPDRLREVDVPILSMDECAIAYPEDDLSTYFCAGVRGKDSCQGDSGGPIIRSTPTGVYQIGVVSFGRGCAQQGAPGVYVNLSSSKLNKLKVVWERPQLGQSEQGT